MEQEDKELLLKDLCARLPYGVIIEIDKSFITKKGTFRLSYEHLDINNMLFIKPYLRPMSSMTEEEKEELSHLLPKDWSVEIDKLNNFYFDMSHSIFIEIDVFLNIIDWFNVHHFDYRGLIKLGLALEAPEGIYK